jgi:acetylglutamate kinase
VRALIKLGGTLLESADSRLRLASEITRALDAGLQAVVVHGGGKQMTRFLSERGIESRFVNGLRVTTPEVLDGVLKVLAGSVNQELVSAFVAAGARPVGLSGMDALLTEARQLSQDLGAVGKPVKSDQRLLNLLMKNGYLPVVACLAGDRQGRFYNVNADQMAASLAGAIAAEQLLYLTDVDGVRLANGAVQPTLSFGECQNLIDSGVASGGMRAKLEAAMDAVHNGAGEVVIAPGSVPGVIQRLLDGARIGTRLLAGVGLQQNG